MVHSLIAIQMGVFDMEKFGIPTYSALIQYIFGIEDIQLFHFT